MRNIIIGLCAALVLYGAQAFGCGEDEYDGEGNIDGAKCTRSSAQTDENLIKKLKTNDSNIDLYNSNGSNFDLLDKYKEALYKYIDTKISAAGSQAEASSSSAVPSQTTEK